MNMNVLVTGATAGFGAAIVRRFAHAAETICWVATLPARVNINTVELMPVTQAFAPLAVHRAEIAI
jgi:NADP-dependent 3-hydroxy acid dehydrogenase YdfG